MKDRNTTLARISHLHVTNYLRLGVRYFVFGPKCKPVKSICTYRKAKVFAEGVAIGRELGKAAPTNPEIFI